MERPSRILKHAWNAFANNDPEKGMRSYGAGASYGARPDGPRIITANERSMVTAIFNRIAVDVSSVDIRHVRLDEDKRFLGEIYSGLNTCLDVEANIDQTGRDLILDAVLQLLATGVCAIVPVETTINPTLNSVDYKKLRVGEVIEWFPTQVKVRVYDERKNEGTRKEIILDKKVVAIVYNPMHMTMNQPNSTLQRLIYKLGLLDAIDAQSGSGKLDLIMQLPYSTRQETRRQQARLRRQEMQEDLANSQYGVAYIDVNEKVIQLNRPAENNLMAQIQYLVAMAYGQMGVTDEIMNGTADEAAILNYFNRIVDPILKAITEELKRKFLSKTARTQKQSIEYFRDPFKIVPMEKLAEIVDKFTRNEVLTSNEVRQIIGWKPSSDPKADELRNSNLTREQAGFDGEEGADIAQTDPLDEMDRMIDDVFAEFEVD